MVEPVKCDECGILVDKTQAHLYCGKMELDIFVCEKCWQKNMPVLQRKL